MAHIREMRVAEKETIAFDFADDLAANEYFVSANGVLDTGLSANGNAAVTGANNTVISQQFTVGNNTADGYYKITLTGTTDGGNVKKKVYTIRVTTYTTPVVANTALALVRLDVAKEYIGKVTDEDTATLERVIEAVSAEFNAYTDRTLVRANYANEAYDGDGTQVLWLKNYPITGNMTVIENDVTLTAGNNNDYLCYNNTGKLYRVNDTWYCGAKTIQVTYTAGYLCATTGNSITLPRDIRLAALKQIAYEFSRYTKKDQGEITRSMESGSLSTVQEGLLKDVRDVLDRHRRLSL